ncbi:hypothetical protein BGZ93_000714 [Podila epicladia]|nr:hypothetical protein BGZ92_002251 [Podila epicladia]KAG0085347.1 hypothetical protein BGZ93_000714 [Podila epicladia]
MIAMPAGILPVPGPPRLHRPVPFDHDRVDLHAWLLPTGASVPEVLGAAVYLVVNVLLAKVTWHRVQSEEVMVNEAFGSEWKIFVNSLARFVPFVL